MSEIRFNSLFDLQNFVTAEYGESEEDHHVLVTFNEGPHGIAVGEYNGMSVYRNPDPDTMSKISIGQSWLCTIVPDPKDTRKCYAIPVSRTEGPDSIAPYVEEKTIEPAETIMTEGSETTPETVIAEETSVSEDTRIDDLLSRIDILKETVAIMAESIKGLSSIGARLEEAERRNSELETQISDAEYRIGCMSSEITHLQSELDLARNPVTRPKAASPDSIIRVEPDTIYSPGFTADAYDVLVSGDGRTMIIRPSDSGRIRCRDGSIRMSGLDRISDFSGPAELECTRNASTGTYIVKLEA